MDDGGVVIGGVAAEVSGASGATVSVTVSPVVISDVVTGPGGAGSGCAALTSLNATLSAPMASKDAAPTAADMALKCFDATLSPLLGTRLFGSGNRMGRR
jgi:hypothetical protein